MQVAILDYSTCRVHLIDVPDDLETTEHVLQYLSNKYNYSEDEISLMFADNIPVIDERKPYVLV